MTAKRFPILKKKHPPPQHSKLGGVEVTKNIAVQTWKKKIISFQKKKSHEKNLLLVG